MPGVNYCLMMGNLTADPELRFTSSGKAVTSFNLAISRFSKTEDKSTTFVKIVTWEKTGGKLRQIFKKGSLASVEGRLQIRPYTDKNGETRRSTEIIATNVQFLNTKGEGGSSYGGNNFSGPKTGGNQYSDNGSSNDYMSSEDIPFDDISMDDIPF